MLPTYSNRAIGVLHLNVIIAVVIAFAVGAMSAKALNFTLSLTRY